MENISPSPRRNPWLLLAAAIMTLTVFIHVFAGGAEIYDPLRVGPYVPVVRSVLSVVWHAITLILGVMAVALYWVSRHRNPALETCLIAIQVGFAGLFIAYGWFDLREFSSMPQWSIFGVGACLILLARPYRMGRVAS